MKFDMKIFLLMLVIFSCCKLDAVSEPFNRELLPELHSPSNAGTEYVISFLPIYYDIFESYNKVLVYFSASVNTNVRFRIPIFKIDTVINIQANTVGEYSITPKYIIPYNKIPFTYTGKDRLIEGKSLIITSDSPIICYAMVRFKTYSEGYLALPVSSLSSEYNISTYNDYSKTENNFAPSTAVITGVYDNSKVTFLLGGNSTSKVKLENGDSLISNYSVTRFLNRGDVWVLHGSGINNDLTGSTIRSTKPVAVFTGNSCTQVPVDIGPCEHLIEQELPTFSYSKRYYVTPVYGRQTGSMIKVSALNNDSEIKVNGISKGLIKTPNGVEGDGFLSFRVNTDNKPAVISSEKRINVIQYNTGNESDTDKGIPFKMQVLSSDNFSKIITFNTPSTKKSEYFTKNYINIIFKPVEGSNIPEDMLLIEFKDGIQISKTVKELAKSVPVQFPEAESDGSYYYCVTLSLPATGKYILKSDSSVGALIYGFNTIDSYGFPAYIYLKNNDKSYDYEQPSLSINSPKYGTFTGTITDEPSELNDIKSNLAMIHLIGDSSYNYDFIYDSFIPGIDSKITFELKPVNIMENAQAYLRIVDYAGNDTIIRFYYSNLPQKPVIKLQSFAGAVYCPGQESFIEFDVSNGDFQGGNIFQVKLGKKEHDKPIYPILIGEIEGTLAKKIHFTVPASMVADNDYYLYVESKIPAVRSDTTADFKILYLPDVKLNGIQNVCTGIIYNYSIQYSDLVAKWTVENGEIIGPDDQPAVNVKWSNVGTGKLKLEYTSNDNCSSSREINLSIGEDFSNHIEGAASGCRNEEVKYNSFLNEGIFQWFADGGKITGKSDEKSVRIKWDAAGEGKVRLIYTNSSGFTKEFVSLVNIIELPSKPVITRSLTILSSSADTGNQWFINDGLIPDANGKSYDADGIEGKYTVQVTEGDCKSEFSEIYNYSKTDINLLTSNKLFNIYPNPVLDEINIEVNFESTQNLILSIFDNNMREVDMMTYSSDFGPGKSIVYTTEKLSSGIYYLRLSAGSDSYHYKLIIIK